MVEHLSRKGSPKKSRNDQKSMWDRRIEMNDQQSEPLQLELKPETVKAAFDYNLVSPDSHLKAIGKSPTSAFSSSPTKPLSSRLYQERKNNLAVTPTPTETRIYKKYSPQSFDFNKNFTHDEANDDENDHSALLNNSANRLTPSKIDSKSKAHAKSSSSNSMHKSVYSTKKQWTKRNSNSPTFSSHSSSSSAFSRSLSISLMKKIPSPRNSRVKSKSSTSTREERYKPLVSPDESRSSSKFPTISTSYSGSYCIKKDDQVFGKDDVVLLRQDEISSYDYNSYQETASSSSSTLSKKNSPQEKSNSISGLTPQDLFPAKIKPDSPSVFSSISTAKLKSIRSPNSENVHIPKPKSRLKGGPVDVDEGDFVDIGTHYNDIHSMAANYLKNKEYNDALEVFTRLLQSEIKEYGEINKRTASTWHNIGVVYSKYSSHITSMINHRRELNDKSDTIPELEANADTISGLALNAFEHAKEIYSQVFGPKHPKVATSLVKLGSEQLTSKIYDIALNTFQEALQIRLHCFGQNHCLIAKVRNNIAISYLNLNKVEEAKRELENAVEILRYVLTDLYNDKNCVTEYGEIAPSEPDFSMRSENLTTNKEEVLHERAIEVRLEVANMQSNLGCLLLDSALKKKREKKKKRMEKLSVRNATTIDFVVELNDNNEQDPDSKKSIISDLAEAEASLSETLSIRLSIYGENHHLIRSTKKKFELARSLLHKYILKEQKKERHMEASYPTSSQYYQDGYRLNHQQEKSLHRMKLEVTSQTQNTKMDRKDNKTLPRVPGEYSIQSRTGFEFFQNQIDELNLYEDDREVMCEKVENLGTTLKKSVFFVKTLEDDEYGYDSDDSYDEHLDQNDYLSDWLSNPETNIGALNAMASSLAQQRQYDKSIKVLTAVRDCHLRTHGELHHLLATCIHKMGVVYLRAGLNYEALNAFEKAISIRKDVLGSNHIDVALSMVKVGIAYLLLQDHASSLKAFDEALRIRSVIMGDSHPSIALVYNNIGCVHVACHHLTDANSAYERALVVQRNALVNEPDNRSLSLGASITLTNIGNLLASMTLFDRGGIMLREAILLQESVLGSHHSTVLSTVNALANICIGNKNFAGALRWYNALLVKLREHRVRYDNEIQKNTIRKVIVCYKISRVHLMQNDIESALQRIKESSQMLPDAENMDIQIGNLSLHTFINEEMAKLEKKMEAGGDSLFWI